MEAEDTARTILHPSQLLNSLQPALESVVENACCDMKKLDRNSIFARH